MRRRTVRVRLTAVYSALFLGTSTVLLVTMNLVLRADLQQRANVLGRIAVEGPAPGAGDPPPGARMGGRQVVQAADIKGLTGAVLRNQWTVTGALIAVLTVVSIGVGWWLAGRMLSPLHHITATARRLSLADLHERIAHVGPRDELAELADTFDAMLDRLQAASDSQRRFAANASHELRTPLAIQRAAIQIGLEDPTPQQLAKVRQELLEVNRRSERLIDGLLFLARSEHGLETTRPVALDVLVRQEVSETPGDGLVITVDAAPVTVEGDPVLLTGLVANLLHNAVRHNRPGGSVAVRVTADAALTVRNTGPEVPDDRVSELFLPFRRLHTDRTRSAHGAGLGLSIVAAIARAHHADIVTRTVPGGGLEMTVRFTAVRRS